MAKKTPKASARKSTNRESTKNAREIANENEGPAKETVEVPGTDPVPADPGANPATLNAPARSRALHAPDKDSNPATQSLGSPVAPNPEGQVQTTIDSSTTTLHPDASILNPVMPDGSENPPEVKRAIEGAPSQPADPKRAAKAPEVAKKIPARARKNAEPKGRKGTQSKARKTASAKRK